MPDFVLELYSEEIPAAMQSRAVEDLERLFKAALKSHNIEAEGLRGYVAPQRLALCIDELPSEIAAQSVEKRGPRTDAPAQAVQGFLHGLGLVNKAALIAREDKRGSFYYYTSEAPARPMAQVLAEIIPPILYNFPWQKSMYWGEGRKAANPIKWVRPLHKILCCFDGEIVPFQFGHLKSGNITRGHRFMNPDDITITRAGEYLDKLRAAKVIADHKERKKMIIDQVNALMNEAGTKGGSWTGETSHITGLVEYPCALLGRIDDKFLDLPFALISETISLHQKYIIPTHSNAHDFLAPAREIVADSHFIIISNIEANDGGKKIIKGNERVLRARLEDALFFVKQDLQKPLEAHIDALKNIVEHAKIGSLYDKVTRMEKLADYIAADMNRYYKPNKKIKTIKRADMKRAARLSKADLSTQIIREFPNLQGIMGCYYANKQGDISPEISITIYEHYLPRGKDDGIPSTPAGTSLALADRIDRLVQFWNAGERPTGSRDPHGLRRAIIGIFRIAFDREMPAPLPIFDYIDHASGNLENKNKLKDELYNFTIDHFKTYLRDRHGFRPDYITAHLALLPILDDKGNEIDLQYCIMKLRALTRHLDTDYGRILLGAHKRARGILKGKTINNKFDPEFLNESAEIKLNEATSKAVANYVRRNQKLLDTAKNNPENIGTQRKKSVKENFEDFSTLAEPINNFFEQVRVNVDDEAIRQNRLALLNEIVGVFNTLAGADLSLIDIDAPTAQESAGKRKKQSASA